MLTRTKGTLRRSVAPVARALAAAGVSPDLLTASGLLLAILAAAAIASGRNLIGLALLLSSALCDILDGDVARATPGRSMRFGAFLDSTFDRIADALLLGGILIGKLEHGGGLEWPWAAAWILALTGGFLVSYARARAEGLGLPCAVGLADRTLRVVLIAVMLLLGHRSTGWLLALIALLAWITVVQRIVHVRRLALSSGGGGRCPEPGAPPPAPPAGGAGAAG